MVAESRSVTIFPLSGSNYPTWENTVQNGIDERRTVEYSETAPQEVNGDAHAKLLARRDCALATIVFSVDSSLLNLLGNPENLITVCKRYFRKKYGQTNWSLDVNCILCSKIVNASTQKLVVTVTRVVLPGLSACYLADLYS